MAERGRVIPVPVTHTCNRQIVAYNYMSGAGLQKPSVKALSVINNEIYVPCRSGFGLAGPGRSPFRAPEALSIGIILYSCLWHWIWTPECILL